METEQLPGTVDRHRVIGHVTIAAAGELQVDVDVVAHRPPRRWLLKLPAYLFQLPELERDPIAAAQRIYDFAGLTLHHDLRAAMSTWAAARS